MTHDLTARSQPMIPIGFLDDLSRAMDEPGVLRTCARWSKRIINADLLEIALLNGDGTATIRRGQAEARITHARNISYSSSVLRQTVETREIQILPDLSTCTQPSLQKLVKEGYGSMAQIPIIAGQSCYGAIVACFQTCGLRTVPHAAALQAMANWVGLRLMSFRQIAALRALSDIDPLTGAFNRRRLDQLGADLWAEWSTAQTPFAVILIDIDHFKKVNDTYGHDAGDQVLQAVVNQIKSTLRANDMPIRMGGEEFCVLMPEHDADSALGLAERLRVLLSEVSVSVDGQEIRVTASFGVASPTQDDPTIERVISRADRAVYLAKSSGRNAVRRGCRLRQAS